MKQRGLLVSEGAVEQFGWELLAALCRRSVEMFARGVRTRQPKVLRRIKPISDFFEATGKEFLLSAYNGGTVAVLITKRRLICCLCEEFPGGKEWGARMAKIATPFAIPISHCERWHPNNN